MRISREEIILQLQTLEEEMKELYPHREFTLAGKKFDRLHECKFKLLHLLERFEPGEDVIDV